MEGAVESTKLWRHPCHYYDFSYSSHILSQIVAGDFHVIYFHKNYQIKLLNLNRQNICAKIGPQILPKR